MLTALAERAAVKDPALAADIAGLQACQVCAGCGWGFAFNMSVRAFSAVVTFLVSGLCSIQAVPAQANGREAEEVISATQVLKFRSAIFADGGQVQNPTSFCFDRHGRMLVTETHRWLAGIEDNRAHTYWIMDDLAAQTLGDRAKLYEKFKEHFPEGYFTQEAERVLRLHDTDGDGVADERKVLADGFRDALDGPAIGVLDGLKGEVYLACIPHLWRLDRCR